jgi:hypothetical protein
VTVKAELVNGHVTFLQNETFEFAFVIRATVGSIVGPDIPTPAEGAIPGGAWVRDGNVLHRVRGPGLPADSLVLIGNGKLQWVMTFPQGPPGSTVEADQTLIFRQSPPNGMSGGPSRASRTRAQPRCSNCRRESAPIPGRRAHHIVSPLRWRAA